MTFWKKIIIRKTRDVNQEFCGGGGGKDQNPSLFCLFGRKEILTKLCKKDDRPWHFCVRIPKNLESYDE